MTGGLVVLTYHAIDRERDVLSTDPAWFRRSMERLSNSGWRCHDLAAWVADGRPAVDRGFAIAFDDGLASVREAVETLERLGLPATIFVVTGRLGLDNAWPGQPRKVERRAMLGRSEVRDLHARGFSIAAHTRTHPRLDGLGDEALESEVGGSKADVEDLTGSACTLFAHPYGVSSRRVRSVAARHFSACFGTRPGSAGRLDPIGDLSRIDAYDVQAPHRLDALLSGRLASELRLRWAARRIRLAARSLT